MRNEEHALFTYRYMYYINKSNGHSRQKCYTHYSPRVTVTDELHKYWERLGFFVCFFFLWDIGTTLLTASLNNGGNQQMKPKSCAQKNKNKTKVSHTSFFISKDQNQIIQIFNYTFQQKCKLIKRGDNCELTLSEVLCSWPQTDFSFFVSVCS